MNTLGKFVGNINSTETMKPELFALMEKSFDKRIKFDYNRNMISNREMKLFPEHNHEKYSISKEWKKLYVGGNGRICWGVEATNPFWKKERDNVHSKKWPINDSIMAQQKDSEYFFWRYDITPAEYDKLMAELETLPKYVEKSI